MSNIEKSESPWHSHLTVIIPAMTVWFYYLAIHYTDGFLSAFGLSTADFDPSIVKLGAFASPAILLAVIAVAIFAVLELLAWQGSRWWWGAYAVWLALFGLIAFQFGDAVLAERKAFLRNGFGLPFVVGPSIVVVLWGLLPAHAFWLARRTDRRLTRLRVLRSMKTSAESSLTPHQESELTSLGKWAGKALTTPLGDVGWVLGLIGFLSLMHLLVGWQGFSAAQERIGALEGLRSARDMAESAGLTHDAALTPPLAWLAPEYTVLFSDGKATLAREDGPKGVNYTFQLDEGRPRAPVRVLRILGGELQRVIDRAAGQGDRPEAPGHK